MQPTPRFPLRAPLAACAFGLLLLDAGMLRAQAAAARATVVPPPGWTVVADAGGDRTKVIAEDMKPGFHVTTGPAAILFDSTMRARGDWRLEATIHLFDPGARAEGFGVIFGGSNLALPTARYSYALLRRDGKAMLKARDGGTTRTVRDWTANAAIPVFKAGPPGTSVKYQLVVEAKGDRVGLWLGPTQVIDAPRSELPTDGIVGIRINHALNVHVERVAVSSISRR